MSTSSPFLNTFTYLEKKINYQNDANRCDRSGCREGHAQKDPSIESQMDPA